MKLSLLTIAMWVTNSIYVKEISACNVTLSSKTNLVDLGSRVSLTCQVCSSTDAIDFNRNGTFVAHYRFGNPFVANLSLQNLTYDAGKSTFTLTIMNFTRSSVGNYLCSIPYTTNNASLTLDHSVPVTFVTLTPDIQTISVLQNVPISDIKCISSEGRPTPAISWYLDKNTPLDDTNDVNITATSRSGTTGYVTTSTLTITATVDDHGSSIYCKVSNGYGHIISNVRLNINVLVVPSRPNILHNSVVISENASVILNRTVSLECNSSGNPTPNISWLLPNGSVINYPLIELKWEKRDNTDNITCTATSVLQPTYGTTLTRFYTTDLRINILYSPSPPTCSIGDKLITEYTIRAIKNQPLNMNCTSKSNPPPTSYSWTLPGGIKQDGQQLTIQSVLSNGPYTLDVNNVMNSTFSPQVITGHANVSFTLDILFPVAVHDIENKTVLRNQALSATCPYTLGNPPETNFTWIHVNTSRVVGREQRLAMPNMQTTDEGFYICRVNNTMTPTGCCSLPANDETIFYVDVQYAADITRFNASGFENSQYITVNENETVILFCDAEGNPPPSMLLINNTRGENDLLLGKYDNTISASIPHARCEYDMGMYLCRANNTHNKVQQVRELQIKIKCAPRSSPFMPPTPKVWTKTNSSVILTYSIVAYPSPSTSSAFVWRKKVNEDWFIVNDTRRFHIQISQDRLQTSLSISNVQADDFTNYTIKVNNDIGTTEQTFVIQANEVPATPENFRVSEDPIKENTFIVEWKPGFNGGEDQRFVIGYKQETGKNWTYKTIFENITRKAIEGLVAATSYQFKMYAKNSVGRSDETIVLTLATRTKSDGGNSANIAAIGGGVGGGILALVVVVVVIWRLRNNGTTKRSFCIKFKAKKNENTVYENSLFRSQSLENISKQDTASSSDNPTKQHVNDMSSSQMTDGLQRTPSFVIVPEPLYGNAGDFKLSVLSVQIQELRKFTSQSKQDPTDIFRDFYSLDTGLKYETSAARSKVNVLKNRYRNMYPYDKNRVVLPPIDGEVDSDFINASFIDGFDKPKKYIAAQGPLERTIPDIWRMIVAENIQAVAMVTNTVEEGKRKCFQYWPDDALNPCQYRGFKISLIQQEHYADFVIRKLQFSKDDSKESRTVYQCHYTAWPDKDVPETALSLLQFWRKVRSYANTGSSPLLVHCSAGVGRTGTFIALDYLYDQGIAIQEIKVRDAVKALRTQRINMVQTKNQYLYLHEVLCEALDPVGNVIHNKEYSTTSSLMQSVIGKEFKRLREAEEMKATQSANETLAIEDRFRPMLCQSATGVNKYVNAVYINTFRERNKLILTPGTTEGSTDVDFLWLLHDYKLTTVVILDEKMEPYIPDQGKNTVTGPFSGKLVSTTAQSHYTELVVRFQYYAEHDGFDVRFLHFSSWPKKTKVCKISDIMQLLIAAQDIATDSPIVVQCRDGYTRSGLFAVLWCIVDRIKRDGEVAVAESVRMAKRRCQRIIPNEEQYRFCHEFAKQYADGCNTYENTEDGIRAKK